MKCIKYLLAIVCLSSTQVFGFLTMSPKVGVFYPWDGVLRSAYSNFIPSVELELAYPLVQDQNSSSIDLYLSDTYMQRNGDTRICDFTAKMVNNFVTLGIKTSYFVTNLCSDSHNIGVFLTTGAGPRFFWAKETTTCPMFQRKLYISRLGASAFQSIGFSLDKFTLSLSGDISFSVQRTAKGGDKYTSQGRQAQLGGANFHLGVGMDF